MQHSWFQFTIISISILVFRVLSTWQLFEPLWVWFMINDKDDKTLKWQEEEYDYTWICSWFNHIFKVIFNQNVSVRADWKNVQSFHTASYSPESVQKSHKPLSDHKLLTATLTWESPAPQRSKEQRGGCITAQLGGRGEWRTEARTLSVGGMRSNNEKRTVHISPSFCNFSPNTSERRKSVGQTFLSVASREREAGAGSWTWMNDSFWLCCSRKKRRNTASHRFGTTLSFPFLSFPFLSFPFLSFPHTSELNALLLILRI